MVFKNLWSLKICVQFRKTSPSLNPEIPWWEWKTSYFSRLSFSQGENFSESGLIISFRYLLNWLKKHLFCSLYYLFDWNKSKESYKNRKNSTMASQKMPRIKNDRSLFFLDAHCNRYHFRYKSEISRQFGWFFADLGFFILYKNRLHAKFFRKSTLILYYDIPDQYF